MKIKPDKEDFAAVEREHGEPGPHASTERLADLYRLAQAHKLLRVYELRLMPTAEPPSRRIRPAERKFAATTNDLEMIIGLLDAARLAIVAEMEGEARKPVVKRAPGLQELKIKAAMLARVIAEMRG